MAEVAAAPDDGFDLTVETLIIGAGACGMVAALAAQEAGQEVLVLEADRGALGLHRAVRRADPGGGHPASRRPQGSTTRRGLCRRHPAQGQ